MLRFIIAKDHELRLAVRDLEAHLTQATQSLAEYKHRAHTAEVRSLFHGKRANSAHGCYLSTL